MPDIWVCLTCREEGGEPEVKLLDRSYGSGRCRSKTCKLNRRIFHKENTDADPYPGRLRHPADR